MKLDQDISVRIVVGKILDDWFSILGGTKYEFYFFFWLQFIETLPSEFQPTIQNYGDV